MSKLNSRQKILVVIPARGGSKGLPRKNIRILAGKPLIAHTIETSLASSLVDYTVVTTDDEMIAEIAKLFGAKVINRPSHLAKDHVPLDPVISHAVSSVEESQKKKFDLIVTIQPTSPLLSTETLESIIKTQITKNYDTIITVKPEKHLFWVNEGGQLKPFHNERKNRQFLDPVFFETGAVVATKRKFVSSTSRFGPKLNIFSVPESEVVDIDSFGDWIRAEAHFKKKKIVIRLTGNQLIGFGHVYRSLIIADTLMAHDIVFLIDEKDNEAVTKVEGNFFSIATFKDEKDALSKIKGIAPNILINDILDTEISYIKKLKKMGIFVVNFEDLGDGAEIADLVVNDLYESTHLNKNELSGYKFVCLRDEFYLWDKKETRQVVKKIILVFGGSDPANLTKKTLKSIEKLGLKSISVTVILGIGYRHKNDIIKYAQKLVSRKFDINIIKDTTIVSKYMHEADIAVTSNGRTIYELSSLGIPIISISQNERELRHLFSYYSKGVLNLGLAKEVSEESIGKAITKLVKSYRVRIEMSKKLLNYDLKKGKKRITQILFEKLYEKEGNN